MRMSKHALLALVAISAVSSASAQTWKSYQKSNTDGSGQTFQDVVSVAAGNLVRAMGSNGQLLPAQSTLVTCSGRSASFDGTRCSDGGPVLSYYLSGVQVTSAEQAPTRQQRTPGEVRQCTAGWMYLYHNGAWNCYLRGNTNTTIRQ